MIAQSTRSPYPLRVPIRLALPLGCVSVFLGLIPLFAAALWWRGDWAYFVAAGATAGTRDLLGPGHITWQVVRDYATPLPWVYPPAFAWVFVPFARLSLALGFWTNAVTMLAACIVSGVIASRVYGLGTPFTVFAVLAWQPALIPVSFGQNSDVALLLIVIFAYGFVRGSPVVAGVAVGLLLFKPSDAAVLIVLLVLRRQWYSLWLIAAFGVAWYFLSVPAAAGDWAWPHQYLASLLAWNHRQQGDIDLVNIAGLAIRSGFPAILANGISAAILLSWCIVATRVSALEVASFAGLIAIATSPHANPYEVALVIPAVLYVMTHVVEPWRTRLVVTGYVFAATSIYFRIYIGVFPLAIFVLTSTIVYLAVRIPVVFARDRRGQENLGAPIV